MYEQRYGLVRRPFIARPTGAEVFVGPQTAKFLHGAKKALVAPDAAIAVIGAAGVGKTTLVNRALTGIETDHRIIRITRIQLRHDEVLEYLLDELDAVNVPASTIKKITLFKKLVFDRQRSGTRIIIVVEDAALIGDDALTELESLTAADDGEGANLVLMGEEPLRDLLNTKSMIRLKQRVRLFSNLEPLSEKELYAYLKHCFRSASGDFDRVFASGSAERIHQLTGGVPRTANTLIESVLAAAGEKNLERIDESLIRKIAADELGLDTELPPSGEAVAAPRAEAATTVETRRESESNTEFEPGPVDDRAEQPSPEPRPVVPEHYTLPNIKILAPDLLDIKTEPESVEDVSAEAAAVPCDSAQPLQREPESTDPVLATDDGIQDAGLDIPEVDVASAVQQETASTDDAIDDAGVEIADVDTASTVRQELESIDAVLATDDAIRDAAPDIADVDTAAAVPQEPESTDPVLETDDGIQDAGLDIADVDAASAVQQETASTDAVLATDDAIHDAGHDIADVDTASAVRQELESIDAVLATDDAICDAGPDIADVDSATATQQPESPNPSVAHDALHADGDRGIADGESAIGDPPADLDQGADPFGLINDMKEDDIPTLFSMEQADSATVDMPLLDVETASAVEASRIDVPVHEVKTKSALDIALEFDDELESTPIEASSTSSKFDPSLMPDLAPGKSIEENIATAIAALEKHDATMAEDLVLSSAAGELSLIDESAAAETPAADQNARGNDEREVFSENVAVEISALQTMQDVDNRGAEALISTQTIKVKRVQSGAPDVECASATDQEAANQDNAFGLSLVEDETSPPKPAATAHKGARQPSSHLPDIEALMAVGPAGAKRPGLALTATQRLATVRALNEMKRTRGRTAIPSAAASGYRPGEEAPAPMSIEQQMTADGPRSLQDLGVRPSTDGAGDGAAGANKAKTNKTETSGKDKPRKGGFFSRFRRS